RWYAAGASSMSGTARTPGPKRAARDTSLATPSNASPTWRQPWDAPTWRSSSYGTPSKPCEKGALGRRATDVDRAQPPPVSGGADPAGVPTVGGQSGELLSARRPGAGRGPRGGTVAGSDRAGGPGVPRLWLSARHPAPAAGGLGGEPQTGPAGDAGRKFAL